MTPGRIAAALGGLMVIRGNGPHARLIRRAKHLRDCLEKEPRLELEYQAAHELVKSIFRDWMRSTRRGRRFGFGI